MQDAARPDVTEVDHFDTAKFELRFIADLASRRRHLRRYRLALNIAGVLVFLTLWELSPRLLPGLNVLIFPPPSYALTALADVAKTGELVSDTAASVGRAIAGFVLGSAAGIAIGLITARFAGIRYPVEPIFHALRSIPVIALLPLAIVWLGIGEISKVALIAWGTFFPVWISSFLGARDVNQILIRSAQSLGASRSRILFTVILPAALPLVLASLRQALAISLVVMVAAELVGASAGLGALIESAHQMFRIDYMFAGLFMLGFVGLALDRAFVAAVQRLFPWYGKD